MPQTSDPSVVPGEPDRVQRLFPIAWQGFQIAMWTLMAVLVSPNLLGMLGWRTGERWLVHHALVRWGLAIVLAPGFLMSLFTLRSVGRTGEGGDEPEAQSAIDPTLGLRMSPVTRWPVDGTVIEAATWSLRRSRKCVASATLEVPSHLAFSARSARLEPSWFRGAAQGMMRAGIEQKRRRASGAQAEAWDAMEFLTQAPVDVSGVPGGDAVVLRTNQPETARALFTVADVCRVIHELEEMGRTWEWSLIPNGNGAQATLRFECQGTVENAEIASRVQALMTAGIRGMARASQAA